MENIVLKIGLFLSHNNQKKVTVQLFRFHCKKNKIAQYETYLDFDL